MLFRSYEIPPPSRQMRRRAFVGSAAAASVLRIATNGPVPPTAYAIDAFIGSPPMIKAWPELKYLVPIYSLDGALSALALLLRPGGGGDGAAGIRRASKLVDRFFEGGLLSNKNVFRGLCVIYIQEINYDDPDRDRVFADRSSRLDDCDLVLTSMESLQKPLRTLATSGSSVVTDEVLEYLDDATSGLTRFLSKVPPSDLEKVKNWTKAVGVADADRNGKLDEAELNTLGEEEQKLYKDVGELVG